MRSVRSRTASLPDESDLATYRVVVEYDGTDFCGFQFQPEMRTVAGELERALSRLFDRPVKVTAAGRTDAGVHALGQVISFVSHAGFPIEKLGIALNSALPDDLSARDAARVDDDFSARLSALERSYTYLVFNRREPSATMRRWSHFEHRRLDLEAMRAAASCFIGTHDFVSFCGMLPERGGTIRTLHALEIERSGDLVRFTFRGKGFLHRMVRILTGTLLEIGSGRRAGDSAPAMLAARDRREAGLTAPPQGLFLVGVRYPDFSSEPAAGATFPASAVAGA
jgi:tRNA pseudouridine38-40 synthase